MAVIAVINRKGGSGKSTLAAHVAAWLAQQGPAVVLADVDRQQSTHAWLRRRTQQAVAQRARLTGWNIDPRAMVRPPAGSQHMVLDTPGGLRGFDLARVVMYADAILMPVCNSAFDRESAADCVAELRTLPRVAGGRCRLAAVGMRIDARTRAEGVLRAWALDLELPFLGVLRDTQAYVRCIEDGLTLFDLPAAKVAQDLVQWQPIVDWLAAAVAATAAVPAPAVRAPARATGSATAAAARGAPPSVRVPQSVLRAPPAPAETARPPCTAVAVATAGGGGEVEVRACGPAAPAVRTGMDAVASACAAPARSHVAAPVAHAVERAQGDAGDADVATIEAPPTTPRARAAMRPVLPKDAAARLPSPRPGRFGRLLDALAIPRFLQRNS